MVERFEWIVLALASPILHFTCRAFSMIQAENHCHLLHLLFPSQAAQAAAEAQRALRETILRDFDERTRTILQTPERIQAAQQELAAAREQLSGTQQELAAARQQLTGSQQELAAARQQLTGSQQELAAARQQLTGSQEDLAAKEQQLKKVRKLNSDAKKDAEGEMTSLQHAPASTWVCKSGWIHGWILRKQDC